MGGGGGCACGHAQRRRAGVDFTAVLKYDTANAHAKVPCVPIVCLFTCVCSLMSVLVCLCVVAHPNALRSSQFRRGFAFKASKKFRESAADFEEARSACVRVRASADRCEPCCTLPQARMMDPTNSHLVLDYRCGCTHFRPLSLCSVPTHVVPPRAWCVGGGGRGCSKLAYVDCVVLCAAGEEPDYFSRSELGRAASAASGQSSGGGGGACARACVRACVRVRALGDGACVRFKCVSVRVYDPMVCCCVCILSVPYIVQGECCCIHIVFLCTISILPHFV